MTSHVNRCCANPNTAGISCFIQALTGLCARVTLLIFALVLAACKEDAVVPDPHVLTDAATGRYCGMMLVEHDGPKAQILLKGSDDPIWFSSARDAVVFTLLPEEPRDIAAIYVSDMGQAPTWEDPGADNWTDAQTASFVIGSDAQGGMGGNETVPFADRAEAEAFVDEHGGQIVAFDAIPADYVFGSPVFDDEPPEPSGEHGHGH